jgi:hypothetical protein
MERNIQSGCGRALRFFWETICPYDIYWGTEVQEANTPHAQWMKFSQKKDASHVSLSQKRQLPSTGKGDSPSHMEHFKF